MAISENNSIPLLINDNPTTNESTSDFKRNSSEYSYIGIFGLFLLVMLIVLPFMFGGRDPLVASLIKIMFFTGTLASIFSSIFWKNKINYSENLKSNKPAILFVPLIAYLFFQIMPLPLSVLAFFSDETEKAYRLSGAEYGYISLDSFSSLSALTWIVLFVLLFNTLLKVPYRTMTIDKKRKKTRGEKIVYFSEHSREFDMFSELIQVVLIGVSLICAIIGISHLVLQMNSLFGLYSYADNVEITSRAHWPFVNANQLAFILEIGLLLSITRFLRERQIKGLSLVASEDKSLLMNLKEFFSHIERQASLLISIILLSIGLFLTMSRAGIALSIVGISILWFYYQIKPVQLISKKSTSFNNRYRKNHYNTSKSNFRSSSSFLNPIFRVLKIIFLPIFIISLVLLFIGGEATHDLTQRVDQTYAESGSAPRAALNSLTLKVLSENLIFGVGLNNWNLAASHFSKDNLIGWKLDYAHNDYLQLASEVGLIGLLFILFPFYYGFRKLLQVVKLRLGQVRSCFLLGLFISFIVPTIHAVADFPYHLPMLSFSIFALLVILARTTVYFSFKHEISNKDEL